MAAKILTEITAATDRYNFHSHTEYCDGHATMAEIARAACDHGFQAWGISPHSPICVESPCNMTVEDMPVYLDAARALRDEYAGSMRVLTALEIDYLSRDFGPHIDYFQKLPLDYRIGSVHFVPTRNNVPVDCDGSVERFMRNLKEAYGGDIRYVVEKYFEQVLTMLELGGFDMLAHFDKIIGNASQAAPEFEEQHWYESLIEDVISLSAATGVVVEINTKAIDSRGRYYPGEKWWRKILDAGLSVAVNSDCHHPDLTEVGRADVLRKLQSLRTATPATH